MIMDAFWKQKTLQQMSRQEWESLCDGCAQCCVVKLEDDDSGHVYYTDIVCQLLDQENCRCGDYQNRCTRVPDCVQLTPDNLRQLHWMPYDCAYRRLHEGRELAWWHPLVSGSRDSVHQAGVSVAGKVISETEVDVEDIESHIIDWIR